jgi:hypothetical protein
LRKTHTWCVCSLCSLERAGSIDKHRIEINNLFWN